jgi:hypothetical protein
MKSGWTPCDLPHSDYTRVRTSLWRPVCLHRNVLRAVFTLHALWSLQAILFLTICRAYSPPTAQLIFSVRATLLRRLALRHAPRTTRRTLRTAVEVIPARCVLQVSVSRHILQFH